MSGVARRAEPLPYYLPTGCHTIPAPSPCPCRSGPVTGRRGLAGSCWAVGGKAFGQWAGTLDILENIYELTFGLVSHVPVWLCGCTYLSCALLQ